MKPIEVRYWQAAPDLAPLVSGYHFYSVATSPGTRARDVFQPSWANLRMLLTPDTDWQVAIGALPAQRVPGVALFGPTSRMSRSDTSGGAVCGVGLTPLGFARLSQLPASMVADRVIDAPSAIGGAATTLRRSLAEVNDIEQIPILFGQLLPTLFRATQRGDAAIVRMHRALVDPAVQTVAELASASGAGERTLGRVALRAFGFGPKLLLRRSRFLRSLHAIRGAEPGRRGQLIDCSYVDYSHFVREAHEFLGMPPGRFLELEKPLFEASARLRHLVLGAPAQALSVPPSG